MKEQGISRAEGAIITTVRVRSFFLLAILLIVCMVSWLFFGTVRQTVDISGIAFPQSGIRRVVAKENGSVQQVLCQAGDYVEQGDLLAVIPQEELLSTMEESNVTADLLTQYVSKSLVTAPVSGVISDLAEIGDVLQQGDMVAKIITDDPYSNQSEIRAYVPADVAATLQQGMTVEVSRHTVARESSGYMSGFLNRIGTLPVTKEQISEDLSGFANPGEPAENQGLIEVRVTLVDSPEIETGTICDMVVMQQERKPIQIFAS